MKKRFIFIISIFIMGIVLCSCSMDSSGVITKISDEVEYTKIENSITSVYEKVSKGCVGLAVSGPEGQTTGSGVIYKYDEDKSLYYVVTNAHVVRDMTSCKVYMGGTKYNSATIVGYDVKNDVGVVTFSLDFMNQDMKNNLYVVDFFNYEDNDLPVVGQTVLAIGCPLGLDNFNSLTTGVVSSVGKLQIGTDAAINPGNSGGGLFNLEGRLIGINTEKDIWSFSKEYSSKSDYYITSEDVAVEGRGFAMSLSTVKKSIESIIKKNGIVERPTLGVVIKTINLVLNPTTEYKKYLPADDNFIYFIVTSYDTESHSTAARDAGIRTNDVILKVNDTELSYITDLQYVLCNMTTEETLKLTIYRLEYGEPVIKDIVVSFK